jgi:predicted Zn-dependent protease
MGHCLNTMNRRARRMSGLWRSWVSLTLIAAMLACACLFPGGAFAWGEFTLKDEKELGDKFNVLIRSRLPLVQDTEVVEYIKGIVARLARTMPPQPFPFTVSVLRHNAVNAFATPGGYIFVHTGLILAMDNESEVAGVIAHEMAHVTQRHIARRIESSQLISILSVLGALAGAFLGGQGAPAAMAGSMAAGQAAMLNYSRNDEREADQVGMNYLSKAGYPPSGMVGAFEILSRRQWMMGGDIPSYLSTHPGLTERVKDMGVRVSRLPEGSRSRRDDNKRFLRVQALVRARYSDTQAATQIFNRQLGGSNRCFALMGLGILSSRTNQVNAATNYFDKALACDAKDEVIIREAGRFHYTKGDRARGTLLLSQAVSMNPNDVMGLYFYARSLGDSGRTAQAIEYARKVQQRVPEDAEVQELLARLYGQNGQLFLAYLHLAYSGLYENNDRKVKQNLEKAKARAKSGDALARVERFEKLYKERKQYW